MSILLYINQSVNQATSINVHSYSTP